MTCDQLKRLSFEELLAVLERSIDLARNCNLGQGSWHEYPADGV